MTQFMPIPETIECEEILCANERKALVIKASNAPTNEQLVLKAFPKKSLTFNVESYILSELNQHPNIIKMKYVSEGVSFDDEDGNSSNAKNVIALEHAKHGDLFDVMQAHEELPNKGLTLALFKQALEAVHFMHNAGFAHMDIKLDNLLMHEDGKVRLSDFDLS